MRLKTSRLKSIINSSMIWILLLIIYSRHIKIESQNIQSSPEKIFWKRWIVMSAKKAILHCKQYWQKLDVKSSCDTGKLHKYNSFPILAYNSSTDIFGLKDVFGSSVFCSLKSRDCGSNPVGGVTFYFFIFPIFKNSIVTCYNMMK